MSDEYSIEDLVIEVFGASDIGLHRQENQDNFYLDGKYRRQKEKGDHFELTLPADQNQIYAVFDGLGGEEGGEISSRIACNVMEEMQDKLTQARGDEIKEAYEDFATEANKRICEELGSVWYPKGGTTFVSVQLSDGVIHPFYLGDSRIYMSYEDSLYCLSTDHTVAMEKVLRGEMTQEEMVMSPENHMLTYFLGDEPSLKREKVGQCDFIRMAPDIIFLLCSDGLHDMVAPIEILRSMRYSDDPAQELVQKALENGGYDNVTPVVIRIKKKK